MHELVIRKPKPGCCQEPFHRVECWAPWEQQTLAFIRRWIWEQLKKEGFVKELDAANFSQVVYHTVFGDCWKDIYPFFLNHRESITVAATHQATQAFDSKLTHLS